MKFLAPLLCTLISWTPLAQATITARNVSIAVPEGKLQLTNPTGVTVTYDIECYDKVNGSVITTVSATGQSLEAKKSKTYMGSGSCAGGTAPAKVLSQGPMFCSGPNTFANRASACDTTSSSVCTIQKLSSLGVNSSDFLDSYWISIDSTSVTTFYTSYDGFSKSNNLNNTTDPKNPYAPMTNKKSGSSYKCSTGSNGTGSVLSGCQTGWATSTYGTVCCPDNNGIGSCKVTITSSNSKDAHLQSPQFKGGWAF